MAVNPEEMSPILHRLASHLVESLPASWSEAKLRVEVSRSAEETRLTHTIHAEREMGGVAVGTDDLFLATRELQLLCDKAGEPWSALVVQVERAEGPWRFRVSFEYAN